MTGWQLDVGASESTIPDSAASTGRSLPDDHVRFLRDNNGGGDYGFDTRTLAAEFFLLSWVAWYMNMWALLTRLKWLAPMVYDVVTRDMGFIAFCWSSRTAPMLLHHSLGSLTLAEYPPGFSPLGKHYEDYESPVAHCSGCSGPCNRSRLGCIVSRRSLSSGCGGFLD
jgi:hypothetical protein